MSKSAFRAIRTGLTLGSLVSGVVDAATPVTPNASIEARVVLDYLYDQFGKKTLAGQMYAPWGIDEIETVKSYTGKYPAIRGEDLITESANNREIQLALQWWKAGGIPTIMWHWGAPTLGEGYENSKGTIDIAKCFQEGSAENKAMWADLKRIADHLTVLRDAKVPVLWRPMHENDGGWFWWGKGGGVNFVKLWRTMFDYFAKERKLDNLIWVVGHADYPKADWNPGSAYFDIAGGDTYQGGNDPHATMFTTLSSIYGKTLPKPLHECGTLPDPDKSYQQGVTWSWWMLWHTTFVEGHDKNELKRIYNHDRIITRDELPDWSSLIRTAAVEGTNPQTPSRSTIPSVVRNAEDLVALCGPSGCGRMTISSPDGRIRSATSESFSVVMEHLPEGVHVIRARTPDGVRTAKLFLVH